MCVLLKDSDLLNEIVGEREEFDNVDRCRTTGVLRCPGLCRDLKDQIVAAKHPRVGDRASPVRIECGGHLDHPVPPVMPSVKKLESRLSVACPEPAGEFLHQFDVATHASHLQDDNGPNKSDKLSESPIQYCLTARTIGQRRARATAACTAQASRSAMVG
jgi:hypothetical protein